MANYIDNAELHNELVISKKQGELTSKAWKLLMIMVDKGVIRKYSTLSDEDKQDAISSVKYDICKYWKGFRESGVSMVKMIRNFHIGEKLHIKINGGKSFDLIPVVEKENKLYFGVLSGNILEIKEYDTDKKPHNELPFELGDTKNKSMDKIKEILLGFPNQLEIVVNKSLHRFTLMDKVNDEAESLLSYVIPTYMIPENEYTLIDKFGVLENGIDLVSCRDEVKKGKEEFPFAGFTEFENNEQAYFTKPSPAFNYFTSFMENAIRKSIGINKPKEQRAGKFISMSINEGNNGLYNI